MAELTQDVDNSQEEAELQCYGFFRGSIVGLQYYTGQVNQREMVNLVREANNPYDRNAIRIDNVCGEKVGHLPRDVVSHVASMVDQGLFQLEGMVPWGTNNTYKMPVNVYVFGPPDPAHAAMVKHCLLRAGLQLGSWGDDAVGQGSQGPGGYRGDAQPYEGQPAAVTTRLSRTQIEDSLGRLFAEITEDGPRALMPAAAEILKPLYPHQQEALAWMVNRENTNAMTPFWEPLLRQKQLAYVNSLTNFISASRPAPVRGGILADDMGLGKTLTVLSLIATNRPGQALPPVTTVKVPHSGEEPAAKRQKTKKSGAALSKMESAAAAAQRRLQAQAEAAEGSPLLPAVGGPRGTLIVCPLSVLSNWQQQIQEHTAGKLQVYTYHGSDRNSSVPFLERHDIVITTYSILTGERSMRSGLLKANWLRVVLDEGHTIRNAGTQQAQAAAAVRAERRWIVSGTPIQNSLQDLYGILSFLRVEPLDNRAVFSRTIQRPIRAGDPQGIMRTQIVMARLALRRTKETRVDGGKPVVELPPKHINEVKVTLSAGHREKYDRWEQAGQRIVSRHLADNTLLQNYTTILEIIMRLRTICDSADLVTQDAPQGTAQTPNQAAASHPELVVRLISVLKAGGDEDCAVCLSKMQQPCITLCAHVFCRACIEKVIRWDKAACPMCRCPIDSSQLIEVLPEPAAADDNDSEGCADAGKAPGKAQRARLLQSAKLQALLGHLKAAAAGRTNIQTAGETAEDKAICSNKGQGSSRPIKSVVFSQFTSMLNLIGDALRGEGIRYVRLDGSTSAKKRARVMQEFASHEPGSPVVFLVSLKAGGQGLNLVSASHVHLLDPWWNLSVEEQAMDRVHRLGQQQPVEVFRYVVEDSIEERMLKLQESKRELVSSAFERRSPDQQRAMRINDIKLLMEL